MKRMSWNGGGFSETYAKNVDADGYHTYWSVGGNGTASTAVVLWQGKYRAHVSRWGDTGDDAFFGPEFDTPEECAQWLTMMEAARC